LVPRDSAVFWVPLIGLYTGMRLGEIIQLRVDDVKERDGIHYFDARVALDEEDDEGAKSLKNENSTRWIPLHTTLFDIGFGDFLAKRRTDSSVRLFPDFKQAKEDDSWSKTFSKWFGRYRRQLGVTRIVGGKDRVGFHSFRHCFEDEVRNLPDVKRDVRDALQGHSEGGVSEEYGTGFYLSTLNTAMQKVAYLGLDIGHLKRGSEQPRQ
jgi:integrase